MSHAGLGPIPRLTTISSLKYSPKIGLIKTKEDPIVLQGETRTRVVAYRYRPNTDFGDDHGFFGLARTIQSETLLFG